MKWSLISRIEKSEFWILEDGERVKMELRYNPEAQSIRTNEGEKRLYFLEKIGFMQNRMIVKNEYSIELAEISELKDRSGTIILNGQKYSFTVKGDVLSIIDKHNLNRQTVHIPEILSLNSFRFASLLFVFCKTVNGPWSTIQGKSAASELLSR